MMKNIKLNYIYNVSYQVLTLLTPLITTPYVSRILGADGIGLYSFTSSITSYFVLFATLGITSYGQREISYVQENREQRTQIFWNTESLCILSTLINLLIYWLYARNQGERVIYGILSLNILAVAFDISWLLQGMEEFGKIVLRNTIVKILSIAYIFIFVHTKDDLPVYVLGMSATTLLSNISLWPYLKKYVSRPELKKINPFRDLKIILSFFVPTIAINIYTVLDKTMVGIITADNFENGYYEQAIKLVKTALVLVTALGTVMIPRIGHLVQQKEDEQIRNYMYRSYRFVWFLGVPLCLGMFGIAKNVVPWFLGDGYDKAVIILKTLSFLILAIGVNNVTGMQYLIPTKRQNTFTLTVIIGAGVNFILNLFFIPVFRALGAAFASVAAESVIAIVQLYIVRRELSWRTVIASSWHYLIAGICMLFVLLFEENNLLPSITNTLILVCSGVCIYFGSLFIMRDSFLLDNIDRMTGALSKVILRKKEK